jgi:hypothetical protein
MRWAMESRPAPFGKNLRKPEKGSPEAGSLTGTKRLSQARTTEDAHIAREQAMGPLILSLIVASPFVKWSGLARRAPPDRPL